ncbi:hypothetical protein AB1K70_26805 [Bremerella sp. JC770]|uniref:hypothetical protein n=1 Tax=Bremerella sp. JC770 TaxID=3232137 RepID=UPI0034582B27
MSKTQYSISQAHRITGKSRTTISAHMDSGKLSFQKTSGGNRVLEASELLRVYGDDCNFDLAETSNSKQASQRSRAGETSEAELNSDVQVVQQKLEREVQEREREREQYRQQIDHLQDALKLAQEGHNKATLLLEHRSERVGNWDKSLQALEARLTNYEKRSDEEREALRQSKKQALQFKKAYEAEKSKSVWQKLFG